jgi:hypothetical protein
MNVTVTFSDGSKHVYNNIPDSVTPAEVTAQAEREFGKTVTALDGGAAPQTRTAAESLGIGVRNIATGIGGMADIVAGPVATVANAVAGYQRFSRTPYRDVAERTATAIGLPERGTSGTDLLAQQIIEGATGALMTAGTGMAVQGVRGLVGAVGKALAAQPVTGVVSGAMASGAAETARQSGAGTGGQIVAGLAGGLSPVAVSGLANMAQRGLAGIRTPAVQPEIVQQAEQAGVNLMTSDVLPPKDFVTKFVQQTGERIPITGTGGARAAQQDQRVQAIKNVMDEYGATDAGEALSKVSADLIKTRGDFITKYNDLKIGIIEKTAPGTAVNTENTIKKFNEIIGTLQNQGSPGAQKLASIFEGQRDSLSGKDLVTVEAIRKEIGESLKNPDLASVKSAGETLAREIYGTLREDMGEHIKQFGGKNDFAKWKIANKRLSDNVEELQVGALKTALKQGNMTPETVAKLLFSTKLSDVRLLYQNLSRSGKNIAKTAILEKVLKDSGGMENLSPEKFITQVGKNGSSIGVYFSGADLGQIKGITKVLEATRRAGQAALSPATGAQLAIPVGAAALTSVLGSAGSALVTGAAVGLMARAYESKAVRDLLINFPKIPPNTPAQAAALEKIIQVSGINAALQTAQPAPNQGITFEFDNPEMQAAYEASLTQEPPQ